MLTATALYAGILGLMSIGVAMPAGRLRGQTKISIGDGGNPDLLLAMRRHSNFVENVPLALILIGIMELNGVGLLAIHCLGIALVIARLSHALGLKGDTISGMGRLVGAMGTMLVMLIASIWTLTSAF